MENILVVKESLNNIKDLEEFFLSKNLNFKVLGSDELSKINSPKSVLICDNKFEESVKGKSYLLKVARNIGSKKIIILNSDTIENYSMNSDMGGSFVNISFKEMDEVIKEIIYQEISTKKYSFSDSKTISLIKIDIEGHEINALNGGKKLILKSRPIILFEQTKRTIRLYENKKAESYLKMR